jgi:hypothetical protein
MGGTLWVQIQTIMYLRPSAEGPLSKVNLPQSMYAKICPFLCQMCVKLHGVHVFWKLAGSPELSRGGRV